MELTTNQVVCLDKQNPISVGSGANMCYDKVQLFKHFTPLSNEDSDLFLQASVEQLGRILRKYYRIGMESSNSIQSTPLDPIDGPSIIDHVVNHLQFKNNCTLVHLAARYNNIFILNWMLTCCCDENCKHGEHSLECITRQEKLWSACDKNLSTPLFYAISSSKTSSEQAFTEIDENSTHPSHESIVFLLSQPAVKSKQLNHHTDTHGNLPIAVALRKRDYLLADLLILFGAKLNITVGLGIGSSESILHSACRERDMKLLKFVGPRCNKVLLKRNQRDENCLFSCLRDFRSNQFHSSSRIHSSISMHSDFLREILNVASSLFGSDIFEKSLIMKNSFGRNILLEAVALNDHESMKVICQFLSNYHQQPDRLNVSASNLLSCSESSSSDSDVSPSTLTSSFTSPLSRSKSARSSNSLLETIVFDTDKQGNSILHIISSAVIKSIENLEDFMWLFDGMKWLLTWMENNFKPSSGLDSPLSPLIHSNVPVQLSVFTRSHKNSEGFTVSDLISNAKKNDKTEWAVSVVSEKMKETIRKWRKLDNHDIIGEEQNEDVALTDSNSSLLSVRKSNARFSKSFPAGSLTMLSSNHSQTASTSTLPITDSHETTRNKLGFLAKFKLTRKKK